MLPSLTEADDGEEQKLEEGFGWLPVASLAEQPDEELEGAGGKDLPASAEVACEGSGAGTSLLGGKQVEPPEVEWDPGEHLKQKWLRELKVAKPGGRMARGLAECL